VREKDEKVERTKVGISGEKFTSMGIKMKNPRLIYQLKAAWMI
jgi:hypothetical protein